MFPYLALLRVGFTKPARYRTAGALLPHLFTLTGNVARREQEISEFGGAPPDLPAPSAPRSRRYVFCCTFRLLRALAPRGTLPCGVRTFLPQPKLTAITRLPANLMILCIRSTSAIPKAMESGIPEPPPLPDG